MKCISITFAIIGLTTGLISAWLWYRSSQVGFFSDWGLPGRGKPIEPPDEEQKQMEINEALQSGLLESGRLNKIAVLWAAASVVCNGLSAVFGAIQ